MADNEFVAKGTVQQSKPLSSALLVHVWSARQSLVMTSRKEHGTYLGLNGVPFAGSFHGIQWVSERLAHQR